MNKYAIRLSLLSLVIMTASTASHGAYNLYKKDGLTLDINGQIDMQATKQDAVFELVQSAESTQKGPILIEDTDKKVRLGQDQGVSYVDVRGSQVLPNDWRVTGNVGLNYDGTRKLYLSNSSLSIDKKNLGAVSFGRQYLHTGYVNRTGTDTPLDVFSSSAVRLDYTGVPGLHASAYYSFAGGTDVYREDRENQTQGFGASASFRHALSENQELRIAAGISQAQFNPAKNFNLFPVKTQGMAASLEYRLGSLLLAGDVGRQVRTMSKSHLTPLSATESQYFGAKAAYRITPVLQISTGYGVKKTVAKLKVNAAPLFSQVSAITENNKASYVHFNQRHLFDAIDSQEAYVQMDYLWRPNVRLYGRFDSELVSNKLAKSEFSKSKDNNYRAGVVFTF